MLAEYNRRSLLWGVPGVVLQLTGLIVVMNYNAKADPVTAVPSYIMYMRLAGLFGTVLLLVGLAYYAIGKGRSAAWCFCAFLGIVGVLILAALKDNFPEPDQSVEDDEPNIGARRSWLATFSLIFGVLGLFTLGLTSALGLPLGILAAHRIRCSEGRLRSQGLAIAGVATSIVGLCLLGLLIVLSVWP